MNKEERVTWKEAGRTVDELKAIVLRGIMDRGGEAQMREIYDIVETRLKELGFSGLSEQGRVTVRNWVNTGAVKAGHLAAYDGVRHGWRITTKGREFAGSPQTAEGVVSLDFSFEERPTPISPRGAASVKRRVYVETSVISYLTARPSKTIVGAAHQQITSAWWTHRANYELLVSQSVWQECAAGDPDAAQRRLAALEGIAVLSVTEDMVLLAESLIAQSIIPAKAIEDALHIAIATLHRVDFLLTWNCRHIANPFVQEKIASYLEQRELFLPTICTPEQLLGGENDV